jgi:hypothetical protein
VGVVFANSATPCSPRATREAECCCVVFRTALMVVRGARSISLLPALSQNKARDNSRVSVGHQVGVVVTCGMCSSVYFQSKRWSPWRRQFS